MAVRSTPSSGRSLPRARLLTHPDAQCLLACGVDPASLPILEPKLQHKVLLLEGVKIFAANILKQTMLSLGGDVAVHRGVISGKVEYSDCVIMGDLRHYRRLIEKLHRQPSMAHLAEMIAQQVFADKGSLELRLRGQVYRWETLPVVMGILNVTPDSFSDGGSFLDPNQALDHAYAMLDQGAEIIDIGGESTRPGSCPIDAEIELKRIIPIVERLASMTNIPISVDTQKAMVARHVLDAGASMINDVSALTSDPDMIAAVRESGAGVVIMHMRGIPEIMQDNTAYADIVRAIYEFLAERVDTCLENGIELSSIVVDPGIGFGKDLSGNLSLLRHVAAFRSLAVPVMLGYSRKSFIGGILNVEVDQREEGTDAVTAWATLNGVDIVRVHDVLHATRIRKVLKTIATSS